MEVFQIGRSTDECIADFHYRLEVEAFFAFGFRHESDIDLSGIQHVEGLVGGLALDGEFTCGYFPMNPFK